MIKNLSLLLIIISIFSCHKNEVELEIVSGEIFALQADLDDKNNILISEYKFDTLRKFSDYSSDLIIYIELTTNLNQLKNTENIKNIKSVSLYWGEFYLENKGFPEGYHDFAYPITSFPTMTDSSLLNSILDGRELNNILLSGYSIDLPDLPEPQKNHDYKRIYNFKDDYNNGEIEITDNKIRLIYDMGAFKLGDPVRLNGQLAFYIYYEDKYLRIIDSVSFYKDKIFNSEFGNYTLDMSEFE